MSDGEPKTVSITYIRRRNIMEVDGQQSVGIGICDLYVSATYMQRYTVHVLIPRAPGLGENAARQLCMIHTRK